MPEEIDEVIDAVEYHICHDRKVLETKIVSRARIYILCNCYMGDPVKVLKKRLAQK